MLIGLIAPMRSGKTTAAMALVSQGFRRKPFAGPLRAVCQTLLLELGMDPADVVRALNEDKATPLPVLKGMTARELMQVTGTEFGRDLLYPEVWLDAWRRDVEALLRAQIPVVVDDVRFPNEAQTVLLLGGALVSIDRPGHQSDPKGATNGHRSEGGLVNFPVCHTLVNDGTVVDLQQKALQLVKDLSSVRKELA